MKKIAILPPLVALLALVPLYAVLINLQSTDIAEIGGTGLVTVYCPAANCQISRVSWVISQSPPYRVTAVNVNWQTANATANYMVYVTLYDNANNVLAYGSQSQSGNQNPVTTTVNLNQSVDPKDIYKVEVVIVEV